MALSEVTFLVTDIETGVLIEGVLLRIYDSGGGFVTEVTTDTSGALVELDQAPYEVRTKKDGWSFPPMNSFDVDVSDPTELFEISGRLGTEDETVIISVIDDSSVPVSIPGVRVSLYSGGDDFLTKVVTDQYGLASFMVPGTVEPGTEYVLGVWKDGVSFEYPVQKIIVIDGEINTFDIVGHIRTLPESDNTSVCRLSGHITDMGLSGAKGAVIRFKPDPNLNISPNSLGAPIVGDRIPIIEVQAVANTRGYIEVDLVRGQYYRAHVYGGEDAFAIIRRIHTPDAPSAVLPNVLFPYVVNADLGSDIEVGLDDEHAIPLETGISDGRTVGPSDSYHLVRLESSNEEIFTIRNGLEGPVVVPNTPGVAVLSVYRTLDEIGSRYPPMSGLLGTITVTVEDVA